MRNKSLRDRIVETSLRLFETYGYHNVSVDQIVKECGTSKGGFYHHFSSKDELLYTIHDQFITYVLEKGYAAYDEWDTPTERLRAIAKSFVFMIDLYKPQVTIFYQESHYLSPEYFPNIVMKRDRYKDLIIKVLREGVECGEFHPQLPVTMAAMFIFGAINWIYKWYKPDGKYTIETISDIYADLILRLVLAPEYLSNFSFFEFLKTD
jgi:AcrR family transcriptional regulator